MRKYFTSLKEFVLRIIWALIPDSILNIIRKIYAKKQLID